MSVISLSSEDENDCIVLDSDVEDFRGRLLLTHQVFIVENIQSCNFDEEVDPISGDSPNIDQNDHSAFLNDIQKYEQLSNQTLNVLSQTKEGGSKREENCGNSQRDHIFDDLHLTSVSFHKNNCGETLTNRQISPTTSQNEENKSESALKVLAKKLAKVLDNKNHAGVCMTSHEQTILDVSRGNFTCLVKRQANKLLGSKTTRQTNIDRYKIIKNKRKKKNIEAIISKSESKLSLDNKVSEVQMQSSLNQSVQIVSETNYKVNKVSPQASKCVKGNSNIQPPQSKTPINKLKHALKSDKNIEVPRHISSAKQVMEVLCQPVSGLDLTFFSENKHNQSHKTRSPDPKLASIKQRNETFHKNKKEKHQLKHCEVLKSRKKSTNHSKLYKPHFPHKGEPYDNKLKFTFDKSVSVYSVSVVSPTESQPTVGNISVSQNCLNKSTNKSGSSCQKSEQNLTNYQNTENLLQKTLASGGFRSPSPIPFSEIQDLKSSFIKHYNKVFDDKIDVLCVEMGYCLLQTIKESNNLKRFMKTSDNDLNKDIRTQQTHNFFLESDELKTALQTCRDVIEKLKRKFIDDFSQVYDQINTRHIIGTQLKIVLLTTWFMKMFLSITKQSPDLMDILHDIKIKSLHILSGEIVRWPLIHNTFIKNDHQFECDCLLVLECIKDCLDDPRELNSQSDINVYQSEECTTSNNERGHLKTHQKLTEPCEPVVINSSNETKTSNCIDIICMTDSRQSQANKQNYSLNLQTKLGENNFHSLKKSIREQVQINHFPSNIGTDSCKTQFQRLPESNYSDNTDKYSTTNCETLTGNNSDGNNTATPCISEVNSKKVFTSNYKRKSDQYNNSSLTKYSKIINMQHISDVPEPKQHKVHENVQPRTLPSSTVPLEGKASKKIEFVVAKHNAENIYKANLDTNVLSSTSKAGQKICGRMLTKTEQSSGSDLCYQLGVSPEILKDMSISNNMSNISMDIQRQAQSNRYPQEMCMSSLQSQHGCKQIQSQYIKKHHSNAALVNKHLQITPLNTFPSSSNQVQNQLYVENQSQEPIIPKQSHEPNVFTSATFDSQYQSDCTLKSNNHDQQNIQYCQSYQPNLYNHNTIPPRNSQSQYYFHDQVYYQESSANQIKITMPRNTNSCKDQFFSTNLCASNLNKEQFPVKNVEGIAISTYPTAIRTSGYSVCDIVGNTGVTINNYNITNYPPHVSPDLITNYNDPTISTVHKRTA